ncbi:MAG: 50S ribosomal protein L21e [archaeon]
MPGNKTAGPRYRSRNIMKKPVREKGLPPIGRFMEKYEVGDRVVIKVEPAVPEGMPFIKFNGKCGKVIEKRGRAYVVSFKDKDKRKSAICTPVHMRRFKE